MAAGNAAEPGKNRNGSQGPEPLILLPAQQVMVSVSSGHLMVGGGRRGKCEAERKGKRYRDTRRAIPSIEDEKKKGSCEDKYHHQRVETGDNDQQQEELDVLSVEDFDEAE